MAHILGNRYCVESLRNDVNDLQGAVIDVFSRVGPVRFPSWKFPDKVSCDLDMTELLEQYDYSEDEEGNQVAHFVLLELVIDRLVLLLQAMAKYTDQVMSSGRGTSAAPSKSNTSLGLVVKKYWNKTVQLGSHVQQAHTEIKNKKRTIQDLEGTVSKLLEEDKRAVTSAGGVHVTIPLSDADTTRLLGGSSASNYSISRDECIKSTQTVETAFVPCESCDLVQRSLKEVGEGVINICSTQDLPSSLSKHKTQTGKLDWMCGNDVARWAAEQNKDLARINKYLSSLHDTIEPLKSSLEKEQRTGRQLQLRMAECAKEVVLERETQSVQQKQYESKLHDMERKTKDEMSKMGRLNSDVQKGKMQLEKQVEVMKVELAKQESMINEIEEAKKQAIRDMEEKMTHNDRVQQLEDEIDSRTAQMEEIQEKLRITNKELSREKAKNKSVNKQTESIQGKQDSLVQRLDSMDRENEELRITTSELEEQNETLQQNLYSLKEEKQQLKEQLREQQAFVKTLTQERDLIKAASDEVKEVIHQMELQLGDTKEQLRLIVEYPDLNGPVNPNISGTGDLAVDMENQVKANSMRISLLEDQNIKLRNSITKVLQSQGQAAGQMPMKPLPLWRVDERKTTEEARDNYDFTPDRGTSSHGVRPGSTKSSEPGTRESFVVGKNPKSKAPRPQSKRGGQAAGNKLSTAHNSSSIGAYLQLKKAGLMKGDRGHPPSGTAPMSSELDDQSDYQPAETYVCHKCDKMYNSSRDLDIHRSYCYGGT